MTGIGQPVASLFDGARTYQQAIAAARLLLAPSPQRPGGDRAAAIARFDEVREEIAVQSLRERVQDRHFAEGDAADRLLRRDALHGTDLARTVLTYLNHRDSVRATGEHMHVHPNTVRYRIEVIRNELGIDLDQPAVRLWLWLRLSVEVA